MKRQIAVLLAMHCSAAMAAPQALVIGNAAYATLPPLPACAASAELVARRLTAAGYQVTAASDLSHGAMDGAFARFFGQRQADAMPAVMYFCGYGTSLDGRDFLLPVSAQVRRPTDLLAEGVVSRSLLPAGDRKERLLIALDLVLDPSGTLPPATGTLARSSLPDGFGVAVITENKPPTAPTAFAAALGVAAADQSLAPQAAGALTQALQAGPVLAVAGVHDAHAQAVVQSVPAASPPPASPPQTARANAPWPDDAALSTAQRKRVQISLATLGYYDGKLDGLFGPDTRAAIRRWQHEKGREMSGRLTGAEAASLVGGAP